MRSAKLLTALLTSTLIAQAAAQTLTVGLDSDVVKLDPALSAAAIERQVLYQVFDRLVDVDDTLKIVPSVAKSWKISPDGLTYTLTLRSGIKFHDGTPLDAAAVKYSLERNMTLDGSSRNGGQSHHRPPRSERTVWTAALDSGRPRRHDCFSNGGQSGRC